MDIVERLRRINAFLHITEDEPEYDYKLSYEAADEIERLREENKQYLECLTMMAKVALEALKPKDGNGPFLHG